MKLYTVGIWNQLGSEACQSPEDWMQRVSGSTNAARKQALGLLMCSHVSSPEPTDVHTVVEARNPHGSSRSSRQTSSAYATTRS
jgi:hypothetical protein